MTVKELVDKLSKLDDNAAVKLGDDWNPLPNFVDAVKLDNGDVAIVVE